MPFVAHTTNDNAVYPWEASSDEIYTCPHCGDPLSLRAGHERGGVSVAPHFWHQSGEQSCSGGESDTHRRMKMIAAGAADGRWPDSVVEIESGVGDRIADVLVTFDGSHPRLGHGIAIECQYRNVSKDVGGVTGSFTDAGYSVLWLESHHFTQNSVDLDAGELIELLPTQLPDHTDWSGHHGIVRWLRQEKPATAEIEIPIIRRVEHVPTDPVATVGGYSHVVPMKEHNYRSCSVCGDRAVVHVRDPIDPEEAEFPRGAFLCDDHVSDTPDPDGVRRKECASCDNLYTVGEMYPYRTRYSTIRNRSDHPFDQGDVEWHCRKCAADTPPLSAVRGE